MKHILYFIVAWLIVLASGCTVNFKIKELELDAEPATSYQLESIELFAHGE